jgi:hypothetical protein
MAFKASNVRQRKKPDPVAKGTQLIPSAAVREWYERQMRAAFKSMIDDYKEQLNEALQTRDVEKHFAKDAAAESILTDVLKRLDRKWTSIFKQYAKMTAEAFTEKVDKHSRSTCWHSLKVIGIEQPNKSYSRNIENTISAAQTFNNTLITNVQRDVHEKIFSSVMLSLTSPDPAQQGVSGIENALKEVGSFSSKRIELIARDQNSKLYSSLNLDRLRDNGIEKFMWIHSSAGKVPRPSHVAKDGEIFTMDDARLWTGPKADQGPPGWAINCLPGTASIEFVDEAHRVMRRPYCGEMIEITTLSGAVLAGTPNHPVLTARGWIALKDLNALDYIIEAVNEMPATIKGDHNKKAPTIADLFALGERNAIVQFARTRQDDFHGDGVINGDVDIVNIAGQLSVDFVTQSAKGINKLKLSESNYSAFLLCTLQHIGFGSLDAANSVMRGVSKPRSFFGRHLSMTLKHRFASISRAASTFVQDACYNVTTARKLLGDLFHADAIFMQGDNVGALIPQTTFIRWWPAFSRWNFNAVFAKKSRKVGRVMSDDIGEIFQRAPFRKEFARIIKIDRYSFDGHVYNLETKNGWYVSGGILTHNCRCRAIPVIE